MSLKDELEIYARRTHLESWTRREGRKVPETDDVANAKNDGVDLEATVLYADLASSTSLVEEYKDWFAAEVYKTYLYSASRIIRATGGVVTAFDGDRVMGVYIGDSRASDAARAGLTIAWTVEQVLRPAIAARYSSNTYTLQQKVGIDDSRLLVARTGIRGSNDLVWVGRAANRAAKLAALDLGYQTYITAAVHQQLDRESRYGSGGRDMWTSLGNHGGLEVFGSSWVWSL